jgi:hypothetical protein
MHSAGFSHRPLYSIGVPQDIFMMYVICGINVYYLKDADCTAMLQENQHLVPIS